jgi:hypothetical protein
MAIVLQFSSVPYPGLRPFGGDESDIFFGREKQTDQLLARLASNRFLAVTGPSGCGKSSLVKAGMIPALKAGFMAEVGSRWRICEIRPGDKPLRRLASALACPDILRTDRDGEESVAFVEAKLGRGPLGLIEIVRGAEELQRGAFLVVVDQFEEIFRYRERIAVDETDAFVALLLASAGQRDVPIYVVITMRSDYLGECAVFHQLPEAVSESQFLTPRLIREELEQAIVGPARVFGGQVDPKLLNRLINDFGTDPDQLPLLQHALARLWSRCTNSGMPSLMTVKDYEAIGELAAALSNHGDEAIAELTPEQQRVAEIMFKRLSGSENGRRDVRAPARVNEVAKIAAVHPSEVIAVAEAFRHPDRSFLAVAEGPIRDDTLLDLSHESLIRQWRTLAGWAAAETESAEMYRRLRDWALRWAQGNADLWRGPDLASASAWRQREHPSPDWAERYGDRDQFHLAMKFLDACEEAQRAAAVAEETKRQLQVRRVQRIALAFGLATASLVAVLLFYFVSFVWDDNAYYKDYVAAYSVPRGIGPLSTAEVRHRTVSYRITKKGRLGPVVSMQLVNAAGQPRNLKGTLLGLSSQGEIEQIEQKVSRWEYVYDSRSHCHWWDWQCKSLIAYVISLDRDGHQLQSLIYAPSAAPDARSVRSRIAYQTGPNGSLVREKGSCVAFHKFDYSNEGYVTQTHYLDQDGVSTPGKAGAFITQLEYDRHGRQLRSISLWEDGRPMNNEAGNAELRMSYDDSGNMISSEALDAAGRPVDLRKEGYQRFTCKYDDRGNCVEATAWHADGTPFLIAGFIRSKKLNFDNRGNVVKEVLLPGGTAAEDKYDENDRPIEGTYFDRAGRPAPEPEYGAFRLTLTPDAEGNITERAFFDENRKPTLSSGGFHRQISKFDDGGHEIRTEFRGTDDKLVGMNAGYAAIEWKYDRGNEVQTAYLGIDNRPIANRNEGFAIKQTSFDACGREIETSFLDKKAQPARSNRGYSHIKKTYDSYNNVAEEAYLDEREQPIRSVDGYARVTRKFDPHRNIIDEEYFDEQDNPLLLNGTYAKHTSRYNDHNALVEEAFFGASEKLVPNDKGWAKHTRRYDDRNALVEEAYFGASGEPVLSEKGWARITNVNDAHGRAIEATYFGTDGKPINVKEDYARITSRYDPNGALVEKAFFGATGQPVLIDEGFARVKNVNDELGRVIEQAFFGVRGEPVIGTKDHRYHRGKYVLDDRGNWLEFATFGIDEKPMNVKEGYAKITRRYDPRGAVLEVAYFGISGQPVLNDEGFARVTVVRDSHGQQIEAAYFGTDGKPLNQKHGYAKFTDRRDGYGAMLEEAYFGVSGEPVLYDMVARVTYVNDELGRPAEWAYFGVRGEPVIGTKDNRYHRAKQVLDERGNKLEFATFGIGGKPLEVADSAGGPRCARLVRRFDATNKEIDSECFDAAGKLKSRKRSSKGAQPLSRRRSSASRQ